MATAVLILGLTGVANVDFIPFETTPIGSRLRLGERAHRVTLTLGAGTLNLTDAEAGLAAGWRAVEYTAGVITNVRQVIIPVGASTAYSALVDIEPETRDAVLTLTAGQIADLMALAGLTGTDVVIYRNSSGVWATQAITAAGRAILDDASATVQRVTLGVVIGTHVLAYSALIQSIADASLGANNDMLQRKAGAWTSRSLAQVLIDLRCGIALPNTSAASTATLTVDAGSTTMAILTAQAVGLTIANPTGAPGRGQKLIYKFKDNGISRSIAYGGQHRPICATALPTATTPNKWHRLQAEWNDTDSTWDHYLITVQP